MPTRQRQDTKSRVFIVNFRPLLNTVTSRYQQRVRKDIVRRMVMPMDRLRWTIYDILGDSSWSAWK